MTLATLEAAILGGKVLFPPLSTRHPRKICKHLFCPEGISAITEGSQNPEAEYLALAVFLSSQKRI